jgi:arylsulfatase A-like enzyme
VQLFNGAYQVGGEGTSNWDGHKILKDQYTNHGEIFDQPTAALVRDLQQRGLLEQTLVVWCTEFGRMPTFQAGANGRDHNPAGFTAWLAGAGVQAPLSYGATDEFGYKAVEKISTVYDFHATILHLLGLDHERLSFYHNGIERRLTDVHGHVIHDIVKS